MLAIIGHVTTTAGVRLPGDIDLHGTSFASIGTGLKHVGDVPALGWAQIFLLAGLMEVSKAARQQPHTPPFRKRSLRSSTLPPLCLTLNAPRRALRSSLS